MTAMALSVEGVLQAAAEELNELSVATDNLGGSSGTEVVKWQALDRISQHIGELSRFLAVVSKLVPGISCDVGPALDVVRVGAVVDRLSGRVLASYAEAETGSVHLFRDQQHAIASSDGTTACCWLGEQQFKRVFFPVNDIQRRLVSK